MNLPRLLLLAVLAAAGTQVSTNALAERSHQGLWWASPAGSESGWGLNITHQGNMLFATWFTYDTDGSPMWLVMPEGARVYDEMYGGYYGGMMGMFTNTYEGSLFRTTGPAFSATPFNSSAIGVTQVGMARLVFDNPDQPTFTYTVNGVTQSKALTRQVYSNPSPSCQTGDVPPPTPNFQDLWWRSPAGSESGWGVNISHQGNTLFATWFTYGPDGRGVWYVMSNGDRAADGSYTGTLYQTRGPAFSATPWNSNAVSVTAVGAGTFTFTDAGSGTFAYTVDGVAQAKAITRQVFSSPVSVCRFP
jgi:hypothetical protein